MTKTSLLTVGGPSFEGLMRTNDFGAEYWSARDLQPLLGYSQWRRFEQAIERAMTSCEQSGNTPAHHFAGAGKMVELGSGSQRNVEDYQLSRFACYLIAMNGDPRKQEIAQAQKYFTVQTRRQELSDQLAADVERLELRKLANRAPLEPPNRGLMEPVGGVVFRVSDGGVFSDFSGFSQTPKKGFSRRVDQRAAQSYPRSPARLRPL